MDFGGILLIGLIGTAVGYGVRQYQDKLPRPVKQSLEAASRGTAAVAGAAVRAGERAFEVGKTATTTAVRGGTGVVGAGAKAGSAVMGASVKAGTGAVKAGTGAAKAGVNVASKTVGRGTSKPSGKPMTKVPISESKSTRTRPAAKRRSTRTSKAATAPST
jgi:hypothetical protein